MYRALHRPLSVTSSTDQRPLCVLGSALAGRHVGRVRPAARAATAVSLIMRENSRRCARRLVQRAWSVSLMKDDASLNERNGESMTASGSMTTGIGRRDDAMNSQARVGRCWDLISEAGRSSTAPRLLI
ncbi:hypothetical protein [Methylobacterium tardum]|uniref:hypothetical protein n=1 Tax=Methylobacterium tardum TaxID=374432 RepID=UPI0036128CBC